MKKVFLYTVIASLICCNYACNEEKTTSAEEVQEEVQEAQPAEPIELTIVKQAEKTNADNRFAFNIFKEVSALNSSNTFFRH